MTVYLLCASTNRSAPAEFKFNWLPMQLRLETARDGSRRPELGREISLSALFHPAGRVSSSELNSICAGCVPVVAC